MKRRDCLLQLRALALLSTTPSWMQTSGPVLKRLIPSTGQPLTAVGLGTWQTFDVSNSVEERNPLKEVLKTLIAKGGSVVDSSPMYGRSEGVVGELSTELGINDALFMATKVWTNGKENGIRQMNESLRLMRRNEIDLMQIHNLTDWQVHLKTLRSWKEEGKIKYLGLTHYTDSSHEQLVSIIENEPVDFIQINYNLLERNAEKKLLPFAQEKKVAVIINQPFEGGALFRRVRGKQLPGWAAEFDCHSWAQFFLKFILSHPAVTCAIPGTDKPHHMVDNMAAAFGRLPSLQQRAEMWKAI